MNSIMFFLSLLLVSAAPASLAQTQAQLTPPQPAFSLQQPQPTPLISLRPRPTGTNGNFTNNSMEAQVSQATTEFGLKFMQNLGLGAEENAVISPLSLQILLNMILLGTTKNGTTQTDLNKLLGYHSSNGFQVDKSPAGRLKPHEAMKSVLNNILAATNRTGSELQQRENEQVAFTNANMMLTNENLAILKPAYVEELKTFYEVNFENFSRHKQATDGKKNNSDSAAAQSSMKLHERVNEWVRNRTQGQIEKLVDERDLASELLTAVLLNAVHFKARWLRSFDSKATSKQPFYAGGSVHGAQEVKFMHQRGRFGYAEFGPNSLQAEAPTGGLDCSVLSLPFSLDDGKELSMLVLLPNKRNGLKELQAALTAPAFKEILRSLRKQQVEVELPKFTFEASYDAKSILAKMDVSDLSDLGEMFEKLLRDDAMGVTVDAIIHKAKIIVDESGAEAAAASMASIMMITSLREPSIPSFVADHPFLFVIIHNPSSMPLFMGQVNKL